MGDATFMSNLVTEGLLPGDLKGQINAKDTNPAKAMHFLTYGIEPSISVGPEMFSKLLKIMENYAPHTKLLANEIKSYHHDGQWAG